MPVLPNQRRELFAQAIAKGETGEEAMRQAGYAPNRKNSSALKANQDIRNRIIELQEKKHDRLIITRQYVIDALLENAQKALGRIPVKIGKAGEEREVFVYKGDVANTAIRLAGLEVGMFTEKSEIRHLAEFEKYTDAELVQMLAAEAQALLEDHSEEKDDGTENSGGDS